MIELDVSLVWPDGNVIRAGELRCSEPNPRRGGAIEGEFRYTAEYLHHPRAFPLDPVALPLQPGEFAAAQPKEGLHAIFEDSVPDEWGRRLLARRYRLPPSEQRIPRLLSLIGSNALGALRYRQAQPSDQVPSLASLPRLLLEVEQFEAGEDSPDALSLLYQAGSSAGGARPKALVCDSDGSEWIAKFPRPDDPVDMVRVEAACLALARTAGIEVPVARVITTTPRPVLLVQRFDVTPAGGRRHMASMATVLQVESYYYAGYGDLADVVRRLSSDPATDLVSLYRRMIFNGLLGNTDDHLKNFMLLHDDSGWRLSPGYDLLPDIYNRSEHVLSFLDSPRPPTGRVLLDAAKRFGLSRRKARAELAQVTDVVTSASEVFAAQGVPDEQIHRLDVSIRSRLRHATNTGT